MIAALLAGAAYQTRTAGICLLLAGCGALLIGKRFRQAALFAAVGGVFVVTWIAWQAQPSPASTMIERYYTAQNYRDLNSLSGMLAISSVLTVVLRNALSILLYPSRAIFQFPVSTGYGFLLVLVPSVGFWYVVGRGVRRAPPALRPAVLFAALTVTMLVAYAWTPTRLLLPVLPILLVVSYLGLPRRLPWPVLPLLVVLPVASLLLFAQNSWKQGLADFRAPIWLAMEGERTDRVSWDRVTEVYSWIRQNTPPDAVILANYDPALTLYTGRASIRPDAASGLDLFYGIRRPLADKIAEFEEIVHKFRPRYLAEIANDDGVEPDFYPLLEALKASGRIRLVSSIAPRYNIYEITSVPQGLESSLLKVLPGVSDP